MPQTFTGTLLMAIVVRICSQFLPGENVSDWNGLEILSPELPRSVKVCVVAFNPAISLYDKLGETRFALMAFVAAAKEDV